jgi:hypothetical protein
MKTEIYVDGQWKNGEPVVGQLYRTVYSSGHVVEMIYQGEVDDSQSEELIPIVFTSVTDAASYSSDFSKITGKVGGTLTINGTLAIPDQTFITPIEKVNIATNEVTTEYITTEVINQAFSIQLTLPGGKYRVTQELMNAELPQPMFEVPTIEIYITI